ncbi:hypothetical protein JZO76_00115 [Enterococcus sp. MJM12]|uniref:Uncharacterized protein n=1 Tax=Candidatus Enterococcus myersii TaxID=2815322 RepID=A0ABS3H4C8_9ENTE|nr:hypothetical protein [Enterococcus sp. MJM12]MBO0447932.1 hypothetical protein [Enterococcus sp. MJM12]
MENNYEKYKNCVDEVKDKNGKVIRYHDVVRTSNGEILLVGQPDTIKMENCTESRGKVQFIQAFQMKFGMIVTGF